MAATNVSADAEPVIGMIEALKNTPESKKCFALKTCRLKSLIKANPPKKAMKALGYRSVDSMIKHENPYLVIAAAWQVESKTWQKHLSEQYKKLRSGDFEEKSIVLLSPTYKKWNDLSDSIINDYKHNLICFKELGALILLPLQNGRELPPGVITASFSLALHELNEIRACSTYLKINQTKSDFGLRVSRLALGEPEFSVKLIGQTIPWNLVHRYYAKLSDKFNDDVFEPYLRLEDLVWHPIERTLASIEPSFNFWSDCTFLGIVHDRKPVSFNLVDNALNLCNLRSFEQRIATSYSRALKNELQLRYLDLEPIEASILNEQLQPAIAYERERV